MFIILSILLTLGLAIIYLYLFGIDVKSDTLAYPQNLKVSIVVVCYNSIQHLKKNLPQWLDQEYDRFDLYIIDDASTDGTGEYLQTLNNRRVKVFLNEQHLGKKRALSERIDAISSDFMLMTDVDCCPSSYNWLSIMMAAAGGADIVLAYAPFHIRDSWVNRLARYDNLMIGLQYLGLASKGLAYMGVGRNLMVLTTLRKEFDPLIENSILSGEDDLFVQKARHEAVIANCINKDALAISEAEESWNSLSNQKRRHQMSSGYYELDTLCVLGLIYLILLAQYLSCLFLVLRGDFWLGMSLYALRYIIKFYVCRRNKEHMYIGKDMMFFLMVLDPLWMIFTLIWSVQNIINPFRSWK